MRGPNSTCLRYYSAPVDTCARKYSHSTAKVLIETSVLAHRVHHHRAFSILLILRPPIRCATYDRYTDELCYAVMPEVGLEFLINIPGAIFDGSVTGVGRE